MQAFSYSSLSSQFLENRHHFWALVPFHYGILTVLAGHILAFFLPRQLLLWNSVPVRLWALEITGLVFALLTLVGLFAIVVRRRTSARVKIVTSTADYVLYLMLLVQVGTGVWVALAYPWGSSWFATSMTPYLWSIVKLSPAPEYIVGMPFMVKLHVVNAFVLILFFPFTRLVHVLVTPNPYLWRKRQVVRWNANPATRFAGRR
jgi:nitrate reductase gamma subunit